MKLSDRQQRMYDFIRKFFQENQYPPTIREIGEAADISSTSVVNYNLNKLVEAGLIERNKEVSRGIRLTGDPVKTVEVLAQRYTLNDVERSGVLRHLITEGELSGYGLVNAVTHYSQEVEDYDRATEFEALGGRLIDLPAHEWKGLAEAA